MDIFEYSEGEMNSDRLHPWARAL